MDHSMLVREIVQEGERWRITIGEVTVADELAAEMFPYGVPYGITMTEDIVQDAPEVVGTFYIGGLTSDTLQHMLPEYADRFRNAGLQPHHNSLSGEGTPQAGTVRTWMSGVETPFDIPEDEAGALYLDAFTGVVLPQITVWDPIDQQTVTFQYPSGATYPIPLNSIALEYHPADKLLNHNYALILPVDNGWQPVISSRTCPRMAGLRILLNERDAEYKSKQLEIGDMVNEFSMIIDKYTATSWTNPVNTFRAGIAPSAAEGMQR
jgi:hypothetical protein